MRRRNALKNTRHAGSHFLAAAFLRHFSGLVPLGGAVKELLAKNVDATDPDQYWVPGRQSRADEYTSDP